MVMLTACGGTVEASRSQVEYEHGIQEIDSLSTSNVQFNMPVAVETLIDYALEQNPALAALKRHHEAQLALLQQQQIGQSANPILRLSGGTRLIESGEVLPAVQLSYQHPIEPAQRIRSRQQQAAYQANQVEARLAAFKSDLIAAIRYNYVRVQVIQEKINKHAQLEGSLQELLEQTKHQAELQAIPKQNILPIQIRLHETKRELLQLHHTLVEAQTELKIRCYLPMDMELQLESLHPHPDPTGVYNWELAKLIDILKSNQGALQFQYYSMAAIAAQRAEVHSKKHTGWNVNGVIRYDMNSLVWTVGVAIPLPFVNTYDKELQAIEFMQQAAQATLESQLHQAKGEVTILLSRLHTLADTISLYLQEILPTSHLYLTYTKSQFEIHAISILSLLEAQIKDTTYQVEYLTELEQFYEAQYRLEQLLDHVLQDVVWQMDSSIKGG